MRRINLTLVLVAISVLLIVSLARADQSAAPAAVSPASAGGSYVLDWYTIDSGGGSSGNGSLTLGGTIGQPDAAISAGGSYTLAGGFWPGTAVDYRVSLPHIQR